MLFDNSLRTKFGFFESKCRRWKKPIVKNQLQMKRLVMGGKQIMVAVKKYILKLNLPLVEVLVAKD